MLGFSDGNLPKDLSYCILLSANVNTLGIIMKNLQYKQTVFSKVMHNWANQSHHMFASRNFSYELSTFLSLVRIWLFDNLLYVSQFFGVLYNGIFLSISDAFGENAIYGTRKWPSMQMYLISSLVAKELYQDPHDRKEKWFIKVVLWPWLWAVSWVCQLTCISINKYNKCNNFEN